MQRHKAYIILALLGLFMGAVLAGWQDLFDLSPNDQQQKAKTALLERGIINILLIGVDARPGESNSRSDTMILASLDTGAKRIALLSIPRDTRVHHAHGYVKMNAFMVEGGPELARDKVEELLGVPVHYYAVSNFDGFKQMVDILGGVSLEVDKRMYKPSEGINLKPGPQKLNGYQALAYCRFRDDALGDIGRTERQQKFIKVLVTEVMHSKNLDKLPQLVPVFSKYIATDIPLSKMYLIAQTAKDFQHTELAGQTLPGQFYTDPIDGISYWAVDDTKLRGIVTKVLGGETMAVIDETAAVKVAEQPPAVRRVTKASTPQALSASVVPASVEPLPADPGNLVTDDELGFENKRVTAEAKPVETGIEHGINSEASLPSATAGTEAYVVETPVEGGLAEEPPGKSSPLSLPEETPQGPPPEAGIPAATGAVAEPASSI